MKLRKLKDLIHSDFKNKQNGFWKQYTCKSRFNVQNKQKTQCADLKLNSIKTTNHSISTPFKTLTIFSQSEGADDPKMVTNPKVTKIEKH